MEQNTYWSIINFMKQIPFKQLIEKLQYLVTGTRPDLSFAINYLSRFMHNPSLMHWKSLQRVMLYLKHTSNYGLTYKLSQSKRTINH